MVSNTWEINIKVLQNMMFGILMLMWSLGPLSLEVQRAPVPGTGPADSYLRALCQFPRPLGDLQINSKQDS